MSVDFLKRFLNSRKFKLETEGIYTHLCGLKVFLEGEKWTVLHRMDLSSVEGTLDNPGEFLKVIEDEMKMIKSK